MELNELAAYGLAFESECFNNLRNIKQDNTDYNTQIVTRGEIKRPGDYIPGMGLDPRFKVLKEAYKHYPAGSAGWQRDYIYYDISPSSPNGAFNTLYKECIWGFEMIGDVKGAMDKIIDQSEDPSYEGPMSGIRNKGDRVKYKWTDGEFEFQISIYIGSKTSESNEIIKYIRIPPERLFSFEYTYTGTDRRDRVTHYEMKNQRVLFKEPIPLFSWNLQDYSTTMKLSVEEVDAEETEKQSVSTTVEFATNFGFNVALGETVKIGAQFGNSTKKSRTVSYEITTTKGNDELGDMVVNFGDIIMKDTVTVIGVPPTSLYQPDRRDDSNKYYLGLTTQYYTAWYRIFIAPALIE